MFRKLKAWVLVNCHILFMKDETFPDFLRERGLKVTFYAPFRPWISVEVP